MITLSIGITIWAAALIANIIEWWIDAHKTG